MSEEDSGMPDLPPLSKGKKKQSAAAAAAAAAAAIFTTADAVAEVAVSMEAVVANLKAIADSAAVEKSKAEKAKATDLYWRVAFDVHQSNVSIIAKYVTPYEAAKEAQQKANEMHEAMKTAGHSGKLTPEFVANYKKLALELKELANKALLAPYVPSPYDHAEKMADVEKMVAINEQLLETGVLMLSGGNEEGEPNAGLEALSEAALLPPALKNLIHGSLAEAEATMKNEEGLSNAQKLLKAGIVPEVVSKMSVSELAKAVKHLDAGGTFHYDGEGVGLPSFGSVEVPGIKPKKQVTQGGKTLPTEEFEHGVDHAAHARTQKRAGIESLVGLETVAREHAGGAVYAPSILAVMSPLRGDFASNRYWLEQKKVVPDEFHRLFFRPCPKTPRHGFVDSKVCTTWEQVEALYEETLKADPEAEVIIMPEIAAESSAVATSTMIAVGPGHDGATTGQNTVVFDLHSAEIEPGVAKKARLKDGEEGYIEAVYDGRFTYLVQLRGGPKVGQAQSRIVPRPVHAVREIVAADGDLLEWEGRMAALKEDHKGVVVWSPKGSMLSHYAVHSLLNGVAISFEESAPMIGEAFLPVEGAVGPAEWDKAAIARGAARAMVEAKSGRLSDKKALSFALTFAATGVHSAMSLRNSASAELLGGASMTLLMLAAAACCGESRHQYDVRQMAGVSSNRHEVFIRCLADYMSSRPLLRLALDSFGMDDWGGSYGGVKWANCAANAIDLENELFAVIRGEGNVDEVVKMSHRLLNAVHNGGKLLNKFGNPKILDIAAQGSRTFAVQSALWWHSVAHGPLMCSPAQLTEAVVRIKGAGKVEAECFPLWSSAVGAWTGVPKSVATPEAAVKYTLQNGKAQIRVLSQADAVLKIQYIFDVKADQPKDAPPVVQPTALAQKFKNLGLAGATPKYGNPAHAIGGGSYTSITVKNPELMNLMIEAATKLGGLEQATSMAKTSTLYVKAEKAEPIGPTQHSGVKVFFADKGVEVKHP